MDPLSVKATCRLCGRTAPVETLQALCTCAYLTHKKCLEAKLSSNCEESCDICQQKYKLTRKPIFSIHVAVWSWLATTAHKVEVVLASLVAALIPYEAVLLVQMVAEALGRAPAEEPEQEVESWVVQADSLRHMAGLPLWSLLLIPAVFLGHVSLLAFLVVSIARSFILWQCLHSEVHLVY